MKNLTDLLSIKLIISMKKNIKFLIDLMNWLKNCSNDFRRLLSEAKPYCNPKIEENLEKFESFFWFTARSLSNTGRIVLPAQDIHIKSHEAKKRQPDLRINYKQKVDLNGFMEELRRFLEYMIILHILAQKNKLFYVVE